jgi:hypothetical protein
MLSALETTFWKLSLSLQWNKMDFRKWISGSGLQSATHAGQLHLYYSSLKSGQMMPNIQLHRMKQLVLWLRMIKYSME